MPGSRECGSKRIERIQVGKLPVLVKRMLAAKRNDDSFRFVLGPEFERRVVKAYRLSVGTERRRARSEEHTSELQSRGHLVCRLLLEKKKKKKKSDRKEKK